MKRTITKTIRKEDVLELDVSDLIALLRQHFNLPFSADVEFDIGQDELIGVTIRTVTSEEVKE